MRFLSWNGFEFLFEGSFQQLRMRSVWMMNSFLCFYKTYFTYSVFIFSLALVSCSLNRTQSFFILQFCPISSRSIFWCFQFWFSRIIHLLREFEELDVYIQGLKMCRAIISEAEQASCRGFCRSQRSSLRGGGVKCLGVGGADAYVRALDADGGPGTGRDSSGKCYPNMPICHPCWPGCRSCQDSTPCWVQEDWPLRAGVLAIQGLFMLLVFVSMLVAYQHRRDRVSQSSVRHSVDRMRRQKWQMRQEGAALLTQHGCEKDWKCVRATNTTQLCLSNRCRVWKRLR